MRNEIQSRNSEVVKEILKAGNRTFMNATAMVKGLPYLVEEVNIEDAKANKILEDVDLQDFENEKIYFGGVGADYDESTYELKLHTRFTKNGNEGEPVYMCTLDEMCQNIFDIISKYKRISKVVIEKEMLTEIVKGSLSKGYHLDPINNVRIVEISKDILCKSRLYGKMVEVLVGQNDSVLLNDLVIIEEQYESPIHFIEDVVTVPSDFTFSNELEYITSNVHLANEIFKMIKKTECSINGVDVEMIGDEDGDDSPENADIPQQDTLALHSLNTPKGVVLVYKEINTGNLTSVLVPGCILDENGEFVNIEQESIEDEEYVDLAECDFGNKLYIALENAESNFPYTSDRLNTYIYNILKHNYEYADILNIANTNTECINIDNILYTKIDKVIEKFNCTVSVDAFETHIINNVSFIPESTKTKLMEIKKAVTFNGEDKYIKLYTDIVNVLTNDYNISSQSNSDDIERYALALVYNKYHFNNVKGMLITDNSVRHELEELFKSVE